MVPGRAAKRALWAALLAFLLAAAGCHRTPGPGGAEPPEPTGPPRNLTILKGLSPQALHQNMVDMNRALGVQCSFCHVVPDYASDANDKKLVARRMLQMTAAINQANFDGRPEISCYTCHHGQAKVRRQP